MLALLCCNQHRDIGMFLKCFIVIMLESKLGLYIGTLGVHDILLSQVSEFLISFHAMDTCLIASLTQDRAHQTSLFLCSRLFLEEGIQQLVGLREKVKL